MSDSQSTAAELRAVAEQSPDVMLLLDREGTIRFVNRVVPPWTHADVIGRSWLDFALPFEHERLEGALAAVLADGASRLLEQVGYAEDGHATWYGTHIGPMIVDRAIVGAVVVARDISAQRERDARLRVADRLATVATLAAGVAHGINNPLSAVIANVALARGLVETLPPHPALGELDAALRAAGDAALHVGDVVGDLSVFVRAEDATVRAVDVRAVLDSTLRLAGTQLRDRARLVRDLEEVPPVAGNEGRLGQVFLNLLVNAAQAIPPGHADHEEIRVSTRAVGGHVEITFADSGVGIAADVLPRLFTPFFTARVDGEGGGLGLAISQRIIVAHGGTIDVDSAPGEGAVFRVRLPAIAPVVAAPAPPARPHPVPPRARILVIDDERMVTDVIARILGRTHDVVTEQSAAPAIDRIAAGERYDAILCDLMMPDLSGIDFHDAVTALAPELLPRIAFMTGGAFTGRARAFLDRVDNPVLAKPFSVEQLIEIIAARLDEAAPAR